MQNPKAPLLAAAALAAAMLAQAVQAQLQRVNDGRYDDLLSVYNKALEADLQLKSQRHQLLAQEEGGRLARAASFPTVGISASQVETSLAFDVPIPVEDMTNNMSGMTSTETFDEAEFTETTYGASLSVPLFDMETWTQARAGSATIAGARHQWKAAEQDFLLRLTSAYLQVLAAQDLVTAAKAREDSLNKQHELVSTRLRVGLATANDLEEATAARDSARAAAISARTELESARLNLAAITQTELNPLATLSPNYPLQVAEQNLEAMLATAREFNPGLLASRAQARAAGLQASSASMARLPKISLDAGYQDSTSSVPQDFASGTFGRDGGTLRVQATLTMPLYAGGAIAARVRKANNERKAAEYQLATAEVNVATSVKILAQRVRGAAAGARARKQAARSAELALDAAQVGYEVGTRNIIDLVNASQVYYNALYEYHNSRYTLVNARLQLRAAQGLLKVGDLQELNKWLVAPGSVAY